MQSTVEQVLDQVKASLLGATGAGSRVERGRVDGFDQAELPALNVRRAPTSTEPFGDGMDKVVMQFEVDCQVEGADWETLADALHMDVETALHSNATLKQMLRALRCVSTEPDAEGGNGTSGRITARYQAYFLQRQG